MSIRTARAPSRVSRDDRIERDRAELAELLAAVRHGLRTTGHPAAAAEMVAQCLSEHRPGVGLLKLDEQAGDAEHYQQHILHVDRDTGFSVVALVWRAGQRTAIHDHLCWGAVAVLSGSELESRYTAVPGPSGLRLIETEQRINPTGDISHFTPPGDIHYVCNPGPGTAISLHVYGADIAAQRSSIRRTYAPEQISV
ncbi:MAG: cysteine dioxygenase family protein [Actinobacteria bacterium]|nr:cysteine dioxygenase family protein [Actinomycetota bacterium]